MLTSTTKISNYLFFNNNYYFVQRLYSNVFVGISHSELMSEYIHEEKSVSNECPNIFALEKSTNIWGNEYICQ